jgi:hypothetical protein
LAIVKPLLVETVPAPPRIVPVAPPKAWSDNNDDESEVNVKWIRPPEPPPPFEPPPPGVVPSAVIDPVPANVLAMIQIDPPEPPPPNEVEPPLAEIVPFTVIVPDEALILTAPPPAVPFSAVHGPPPV